MDANPFGPTTSDEVTVVNNLQTVLLNLDPSVTQQMFSDLLDTEIPQFEDWQTEVVVTADENPDPDIEDNTSGEGFLIGLSEQPKIITSADIEKSSPDADGGRVDLYATGTGLFIIEAKTKGSLSKSQLSRYSDSLPGNHSYKTISWSDLTKALRSVRDQMDPYARGLTDDYMAYLDEAGLAVPYRLVQRSYSSKSETGLKKFAIKGGEELTIEFSWEENGTQQHYIELTWEQFVDLFKQVNSEILRDAFVEPDDFDVDQHFEGSETLGSISPVHDFNTDTELRFVYTENQDALKLGHRKTKTSGPIGTPVGKGRQGWMITSGEGSELFIDNSEQYPGLDESVRRALFIDFDREAVEDALW